MTHSFITFLQSLAEGENRGPLAALRRGLGQPTGRAAEMYRYVVPWLDENASRMEEAAYYLVASLFAYHPVSTDQGNLGTHLAHTRSPEGSDDALERRFTALLASHPDDLPVYLRQAISYLKSKEVPVNWDELLKDLKLWHFEDRRVQRRWAREFWRRSQPESSKSE